MYVHAVQSLIFNKLASEEGHEAVVKLLLTAPKVDVGGSSLELVTTEHAAAV